MLISLYVGPEPSWLAARDRQALETHLAACAACRRDWQESREALGLLREYWQISEDTKVLLQRRRQSGRYGVGSRIVPLLTGRHVAAGVVAAGLVFAVLGVWAVFPGKAPRIGLDRRVVVPGADRPLTVASANGALLASGTFIGTAAGETRHLVLNARHQIVMRGGTRLSCAPLVADGRTGCLVHLARGEIFARVEHDGNPFVVQTARGRAVITGTAFDIKMEPAGMTLAVVEGSVRFESAGGHVQVVAEQSSTIAATSAVPSTPARCDAGALTAWAKAGPNTTKTAQNTPADHSSLDDLFATLSAQVEVQADLDKLDYRQWVEQKRGWFRQQFPWVFALQKALEQEGVPTDYPTLLRQSAAIWQFTYPLRDPGRPVEPNAGSLLRAASCYGRDEHWLARQGLLPSGLTDGAPRAKGPEAFDQWAAALEAQVSLCAPDADSRVRADTVNACLYLINTRTLALLSLRHDSLEEAPRARGEIESLLQEQLRRLARCVRLSCEPGPPRPGERLCQGSDQLRRLAAEIRDTGPLEGQLRRYEEAISQ